MAISMSKLIRCFFSGALILSLSGCFGCASASSDQADFGYKTIFISSNTSVEVLRMILNDWGDIVEAIYRYHPKQCVRENLEIDSLTSLGSYHGREKEKYLSLVGVPDQNKAVKILSIGTKAPCSVDPNSSGPAWVVLYIGGTYKVLDYTFISE